MKPKFHLLLVLCLLGSALSPECVRAQNASGEAPSQEELDALKRSVEAYKLKAERAELQRKESIREQEQEKENQKALDDAVKSGNPSDIDAALKTMGESGGAESPKGKELIADAAARNKVRDEAAEKQANQQKEAAEKQANQEKIGRESERLGALGKKTYEEDTSALRAKNPSGDPCAYSASVNENSYACAGTKGLIETAEVTHQTTQVLGTVATQAIGQVQTQKASQQNSQAGYLEAGANVQETTGNMQLGLGAMNAVMGAMQIMNASKHRGLKEKLAKIKDSSTVEIQGQGSIESIQEMRKAGNDLNETGYAKITASSPESQKDVDNVMTRFKLNQKGDIVIANKAITDEVYNSDGVLLDQLREARQDGMKRKKNHVQGMFDEVLDNASGEQSGVAEQSKKGGIASLVVGAGQLIQGYFAKESAKQLNKAADTLRKPLNQGSFTMPNFAPNPGAKVEGGGGGTVITGNGNAAVAENQAAAEEEQKSGDLTLGTGFNTNTDPGALSAQGPAPQPGTGGGGDGVQGSGAVGGGATGAGEEGAGDAPKAEYAANLRDPGSQYISSGGGYVGGGGGGGGGEAGVPDLSGMLEKLLGKNGDTQFQGKPSLEEFGRNPASAPYSYLDKSVNIFDRIHQAYQVKSKTGRVGL